MFSSAVATAFSSMSLNKLTKPNGLIFAVDVSGSMRLDADTGIEACGTRMDLAKHAIKCAYEITGNSINFGLYPFTDTPINSLPIGKHSAGELKEYMENTLNPKCGTILLPVLKQAVNDAINAHINDVTVLTDGELEDSKDVMKYLTIVHTANPNIKVNFIALGAQVPTKTAGLASITNGSYYMNFNAGRTNGTVIDFMTNMLTECVMNNTNADYIIINQIRVSFIEMINKLIECLDTNNKDRDGALSIVNTYETYLKSLPNVPNYVFEELSGASEIRKLITILNAYGIWGKHHLQYLSNALTNMNASISESSPILTMFNTDIRNELMKQYETYVLDASENVIIPVAVARGSSQRRLHTSTPTPTPTYYNYSGGCFTSTTRVHKVVPSTGKEIQTTAGEIKKGDNVVVGYDADGNPITSCILCVIIVYYTGDLFNGLTPYHPIGLFDKNGGKITYIFAKDMTNVIVTRVVNEPVYDFLFDSKAKLGYFTSTLNGINVQILTLGHGITEGDANHEYFTNYTKNYNAAEQHPGFVNGLIDSHHTIYTRDPETHYITNIEYKI